MKTSDITLCLPSMCLYTNSALHTHTHKQTNTCTRRNADVGLGHTEKPGNYLKHHIQFGWWHMSVIPGRIREAKAGESEGSGSGSRL